MIEPATLHRLPAALARQRPEDIESLLGSMALIAPLLDTIANAVFFIKDLQARYLIANLTLAQRCGFKNIEPLLGKTSAEVFPAVLGPVYTEQDQRVLRHGISIKGQLELHLYGSREPGWCLTHKLPLHGRAGQIIGMAGISLDLQAAHDTHPAYERLAAVDRYIREHYSEAIRLEQLTEIADLSIAQLERYCKRIFHLTPRQMIHKARLEHASRLLLGELPITEVALQCGYTDHSAFSRQFKALTGISPRQFRHNATR
ncbi:AraC family transcriptional regulator [Pseudomonas sp. TH05]|uniref:AraC family transcriptional regulator n=1 Tax=unclassified Pseudomonas TaxID=196821 RepID=UPI000998BCAD|nr:MULTISPECIES: AraC family transcriptional regulator [unclassified Pseudomonas]MBK5539580.1 AraC family transcriptional regulator [Pseudomonas sp. TH07]MBK5554877.1 AraC family transcriptional regulator [Pseudomonas sp. TH05]OOV91012.1 AraC family transcriptional regulator [Pseudomonas sp. MF4836]